MGSTSSPNPELPELIRSRLSQLQTAERRVAGADAEDIELTNARERINTRSKVTFVIIAGYVLIVGVTSLFLLAKMWNASDWSAILDRLMDLIKVALLPVVTFVIGHYFGSSK